MDATRLPILLGEEPLFGRIPPVFGDRSRKEIAVDRIAIRRPTRFEEEPLRWVWETVARILAWQLVMRQWKRAKHRGRDDEIQGTFKAVGVVGSRPKQCHVREWTGRLDKGRGRRDSAYSTASLQELDCRRALEPYSRYPRRKVDGEVHRGYAILTILSGVGHACRPHNRKSPEQQCSTTEVANEYDE